MAKSPKPEAMQDDLSEVALMEPKTAGAMLAYLAETGTSAGRLRPLEAWAKENPKATADDLYRHMETTCAYQGTLRKAGKWIFGDTFEPEDVVKQAPADEMLRVREENERIKSNVAGLQADKLGLINQNKFLQEQIAELTRQVSFLKMGKSREELAQIGL